MGERFYAYHGGLCVRPNVRANRTPAAGWLGPGWRKCTVYRQTGPRQPAVGGPVVQRGVRPHCVFSGGASSVAASSLAAVHGYLTAPSAGLALIRSSASSLLTPCHKPRVAKARMAPVESLTSSPTEVQRTSMSMPDMAMLDRTNQVRISSGFIRSPLLLMRLEFAIEG